MGALSASCLAGGLNVKPVRFTFYIWPVTPLTRRWPASACRGVAFWPNVGLSVAHLFKMRACQSRGHSRRFIRLYVHLLKVPSVARSPNNIFGIFRKASCNWSAFRLALRLPSHSSI